MDLVPYGRKTGDEWDHYLAEAPEGTIFHTWDWLSLAGRYTTKKVRFSSLKGTFHPFLALTGDQPVALVPLFTYSTPLFSFVSSPPFSTETPYLGPVLLERGRMRNHGRQKAWYELRRAIDTYLTREFKPSFVSFHSSPGSFDPRPFQWEGYHVYPEFTYEIDLSVPASILYDNFTKTLRNQIRKAEKAGMTVRSGNRSDLECIYNRLAERDRVHAKKEFITAIFDRFQPGMLQILVVEKGDAILGGVVTLHYRNRGSFWLGSPRSEYNGVSPNILALWEAIRHSQATGAGIFELIGASDRSVYPFKCKFNGTLSPIYLLKRYTSLAWLLSRSRKR